MLILRDMAPLMFPAGAIDLLWLISNVTSVLLQEG